METIKAIPITQRCKPQPVIVEPIKELTGRRGIEAAYAEEATD